MYRTHPFLLEYDDYNVYSPTDVALVTQCSFERIPLLEALSKHWPGTVSVAIYLTDAEVQNFLDYVRGSADLRARRNIAYHVVYKDGVRCGMCSVLKSADSPENRPTCFSTFCR